MKTIAIIGSSGAIGSAFTRHYAGLDSTDTVYALSRSGVRVAGDKIRSLPIDITNDDTVAQAAAALAGTPLQGVIMATGILHDEAGLHPEKSLGDIDADKLRRVLDINTVGPALVMKHFLPLLDQERRSLFAALSARVGSIGDNRLGGWYAYRASKAALNMLIRTAALEMKRRNRHAIVVGLHPGTVDSRLSRPFQSRVPEGRLFTADAAASRLADVLARLEPADSGSCLAWDGQPIVP